MAKHDMGCERRHYGGLGQVSPDCTECVAQVEAGVTHKPDCKAAFGRKDQTCGRCRALLSGVAPARHFRRLARYS